MSERTPLALRRETASARRTADMYDHHAEMLHKAAELARERADLLERKARVKK